MQIKHKPLGKKFEFSLTRIQSNLQEAKTPRSYPTTSDSREYSSP